MTAPFDSTFPNAIAGPPQRTGERTGDDPIVPPLRRPPMKELGGGSDLGQLLGLLDRRPQADHATIAISALSEALASARVDLMFWRARALELEAKLEAERALSPPIAS